MVRECRPPARDPSSSWWRAARRQRRRSPPASARPPASGRSGHRRRSPPRLGRHSRPRRRAARARMCHSIVGVTSRRRLLRPAGRSASCVVSSSGAAASRAVAGRGGPRQLGGRPGHRAPRQRRLRFILSSVRGNSRSRRLPNDPPSLVAFHADGTYQEADADGTVGIGSWEATGPSSLNLTFDAYLPDAATAPPRWRRSAPRAR